MLTARVLTWQKRKVYNDEYFSLSKRNARTQQQKKPTSQFVFSSETSDNNALTYTHTHTEGIETRKNIQAIIHFIDTIISHSGTRISTQRDSKRVREEALLLLLLNYV